MKSKASAPLSSAGPTRFALDAGGASIAPTSLHGTMSYFARRVFWCIEKTITEAGFHTYPYHVWIPSFEAWGFVMATPAATENGTRDGGKPLVRLEVSTLRLQVKTRFLTDAFFQGMFHFPKDMSAESLKTPVEVNRLDRHPIVGYHAESWRE